MLEQAYHAARMVAVDMALRSLLAEAQVGTPFDEPDAICVTLSTGPDGALEVTYSRNGRPVSGEGM